MRVCGGSFDQAELFVNGSPVPRPVRRAYVPRVPDGTTRIRWAELIGPDTLRGLSDRAVAVAAGLEVARGRKPRADTTAVAADIHCPADGP